MENRVPEIKPVKVDGKIKPTHIDGWKFNIGWVIWDGKTFSFVRKIYLDNPREP